MTLWSYSQIVYDVEDNLELGHITENYINYGITSVGHKDDTTIVECKILEKECVSMDDFNNKINPYITN